MAPAERAEDEESEVERRVELWRLLHGARLLEVGGLGHCPPAAVHRVVADAILQHARRHS
ncbi:hypothetical protein JOF41_001923 [Saccharothrix coeruleofusca]|uniref:hypothetical protein n=1 Tax=Saccharothrix coeruleofusca TaxID=33919 RepID=UPI001AE1F5E5|nr:hypothetical protein [Saccharothrix coeruleofusca]MBP2335745.1 hypothetical protein [Saccharothrix coeruleofusca]